MTNKATRKIEILRRRMNHLLDRIENGKGATHDFSYDLAEIGALRWAINELEEIHGDD